MAVAEAVPEAVEQVLIGEPQEPADFPDVRLNQKFVQLRQGKPFVAYPGLLDLLHQLSEGFFAIDTEVLQLPTAENNLTAVCQARVRIFDPQDADVVRRLTTGIGDADPTNVSAQMKPHLLRMAETRAKARALRDAVNVGMAALEELGPDTQDETPAPVVEGIVVEGRRFTRPQVEAAYKVRRAEAERLSISLPPDTAALQAAHAPLPVLVAATQQLKRLVEATVAGSPQAGQR